MKRQAKIEEDNGLDSLMDTMTNVVGILVLVLIVAQLGVADVVSRVISKHPVDQQTIDDAQQRLVQKQTEQSELYAALYQPTNVDIEQLQQELSLKQELLERRKQLLAEKEEQRNQAAIKIQQDQQLAAQTQAAIAEQTQQQQQLATRITAALQQKAQLEAMLEQTPESTTTTPVYRVTIPNPRPAPEGASEFVLICANNRLYPLFPARLAELRQAAESLATQIVTRYGLDQDPADGIDAEEFSRHFSQRKVQDEFFEVECYVEADKYPRLRFVPRADRGASFKELANPRGRIYKKWFGALDPQQMYARFHVLPDSYQVYTAVRRAFDSAQILSGWEPQDQDWLFTTSIPGGLVLGPPPPPPPPAPPNQPPNPPPPPPNLID
jgi:hypothetical protein